MATVCGLGLASPEAQAQAVSEPNFSIGGAGGDFTSKGAGFGIGRIDLPVGPFGVQADPFVGDVGGRAFYGTAGQFFARDPDLGSLSALGQFEWYRGASVRRYGAQGEYYTPRIDLAVRGGYQDGHKVGRGGFGEAH
ncbi:MAG: hypothetical protein JO032_03410, partial [Alphaproteobacteria bacterium]|nr:hypothetical protein [Alphaproteobacteria bacterium]